MGGYASALMHFLAGLLFVATGSYIVDKIDYPDDWSWDFSFIMVWLAWLLCWLTTVLNVCGAIAMGRESKGSEHETEHISGDIRATIKSSLKSKSRTHKSDTHEITISDVIPRPCRLPHGQGRVRMHDAGRS